MFNTLDNLDKYAIINATISEIKVTNWFKKQIYRKLNFLLNEGVIKYRVEGNSMINYFKVSPPLSNGEYVLYLEQYINRNEKSLSLIHSTEVIFRENKYESIYEKANIKGKGAKKSIELVLNTCLAYFYYLDTLVKNKETIIKTPNKTTSEYMDTTSLTSTDEYLKNNIRIISNKKVVYEFSNLNNNSNIHKTIFNRKTGSWNVIGHYRHYNNGKVIFIKPYAKGKGKKVNKIYKV